MPSIVVDLGVAGITKLLEFSGLIDSLDAKVDRISNSKLNGAMELLKNIKYISHDENEVSNHLDMALNKLMDAITHEKDLSRKATTKYLIATIYSLKHKTTLAAKYFEEALKTRGHAEISMSRFINPGKLDKSLAAVRSLNESTKWINPSGFIVRWADKKLNGCSEKDENLRRYVLKKLGVYTKLKKYYKGSTPKVD